MSVNKRDPNTGNLIPIAGNASSGSGGHVIEDATGTDLTQRANLQFKGVRVSDDNTNDRTVVDATNETIDWSSWIAMTDAQQEAYLEAHPNLTVLNAPYEDADIPFMTKLWENPSPSSAFGAQSITLSSDDYDFLLFIFRNQYDDTAYKSVIVPKGETAYLDVADAAGGGARGIYRKIAYASDTSYSVGQSRIATGATASSYSDNYCVPTIIYGLKKSVSINAIAADVSTSASKCMMDDGETSVEEAITNLSTPIDISSALTVEDTNCTINSAYYINSVVCISGNVSASCTSGSTLFTFDNAKYKPKTAFTSTTQRADQHGVISILDSAIYYCEATYAYQQSFSVTYICNG